VTLGGYLSEQVFHLGLLGPEAFDLLLDAGIFLQLLHRGPLAVKVGTETQRRASAERGVPRDAREEDRLQTRDPSR